MTLISLSLNVTYVSERSQRATQADARYASRAAITSVHATILVTLATILATIAT